MTRTLIKATAAAVLGLGALAAPAIADDSERNWTFSFNAGGTSDYIFRGVSQNNEDPAFQAGVDVTYGIFYIGAWGSGVDKNFVGGAVQEIDVYAGITPSLGIADFDFGVIYYGYPNQKSTLATNGLGQVVDVDYWEGKAGVSTDDLVKNLTVGVTAYYSPEYTFESGEVWTFEGSASYGLPSVGPFSPTISGLVGYQVSDASSPTDLTFDAAGLDDDYWYWNVGLELAVDKLSFDLRYHDTDLDQTAGAPFAGLSDERFVGTATFTY